LDIFPEVEREFSGLISPDCSHVGDPNYRVWVRAGSKVDGAATVDFELRFTSFVASERLHDSEEGGQCGLVEDLVRRRTDDKIIFFSRMSEGVAFEPPTATRSFCELYAGDGSSNRIIRKNNLLLFVTVANKVFTQA